MNTRLIRHGCIVSAVPFVASLLMLFTWNNVPLRGSLLLLGTLCPIPLVLMFRLSAKRVYRPALNVLKSMGIQRIPTAYDPGRFHKDCKAWTVLSWASCASPLFAFAAKNHPTEIVVPVLNFATYSTINLNYFFLSILCALLGGVAFCLWAKLDQAAYIANEGSDGNRYLYQGFAEALESKGCRATMDRYLNLYAKS